MRAWLQKIGRGLSRFMQGRYGYDEFSRFLSIVSIVLFILSCFRYIRFLYFFAVAVVAYSIYRTLSRNIYARQKERAAYLKFRNAVASKFAYLKNRWRDRKTHLYLKCPSCKAHIRIHRPGRGREITITCPKCGNKFDMRT